MRRRALLTLLATATLLLAACTSSSDPTPTATPTIEATPTLAPSPTATSETAPPPEVTPTSTAVVGIEAPATVWLIDTRTAEVHTLTEDTEHFPWRTEFNADGYAVVRYADRGEPPHLAFDIEGQPTSEEVPVAPCTRIDDETITVNGNRIDSERGVFNCGLVSPNERWMTYVGQVERDFIGGADRIQSWDQWVLNLETNESRLVQAGLRHCGGCDGVFGPFWSPSGRYLVLPELGVGEVYLADMQTETIRPIGGASGSSILQRPNWAPGGDRILHPDGTGHTVIEDLETGTRVVLDTLPWPATFDPTGRHIYSPAWDTRRDIAAARETTVLDATTLLEVGIRPGGAPGDLIYGAPGTPVMATEGGFVAALEGTSGCRGTALYAVDGSLVTCVEQGSGAVFSPDGTRLALAVHTGSTTQSVNGPGFWGITARTFDIVLVDVATGSTEVLATDALSSDAAPLIIWNDEGTHILVRWPASWGI